LQEHDLQAEKLYWNPRECVFCAVTIGNIGREFWPEFKFRAERPVFEGVEPLLPVPMLIALAPLFFI
jgi:hypothetical protein